MRLLEQGPESQSASWICSVGPSSLMNASDLDDHSFVPSGHKVIGIKAHCPIYGIYGNVGVTCRNGLLPALGTDEKHWHFLSSGKPVPPYLTGGCAVLQQRCSRSFSRS